MYLYDAIYAHSNKRRYILRPRGEVNADRKLTLYLPVVYKQDKKRKKEILNDIVSFSSSIDCNLPLFFAASIMVTIIFRSLFVCGCEFVSRISSNFNVLYYCFFFDSPIVVGVSFRSCNFKELSWLRNDRVLCVLLIFVIVGNFVLIFNYKK